MTFDMTFWNRYFVALPFAASHHNRHADPNWEFCWCGMFKCIIYLKSIKCQNLRENGVNVFAIE